MLEKELMKGGGGEGSMDWIIGYDPVEGWNKPPVVPVIA
jgi:hypothetical protein